jgi:acyl carrier protein
MIAGIWSEVLSLDQVGVNDNFFDLGGHSLTATRVVSRVIKEFLIDVPLQFLFQSPTVAEMATVITENQAKVLRDGKLERIVAELESMSDEGAQRLLAEAGKQSRNEGG